MTRFHAICGLAILLDDTRSGYADKLLVYYADGDYSFDDEPESINLPTNCNPTDLVTGTFNQDNYPDVAVTCSSPAQVRVYRGGLDGTGGFYLSSFKTADSGVVAMAVEQFDTQYQDFIYLPEGRNAGYGAVIWTWEIAVQTDPPTYPRYFLFVSNHTVDPDSVGDFDDCEFDYGQGLVHLLDEETSIPVGHTISVYEINPAPFAPTSWRTTNDVLMATLDMDAWTQPGEGCGPQGLAILTDPDEDDYLYVANAYSGTVTAVNLQTLFDSLLDDYTVHTPPPDAKVPITTGVEDYIVVGPRTDVEEDSWDPPYEHLITRAVAFYVGEEDTDDDPPQAVPVWRLAASVSGYGDAGGGLPYPASMARLDIDPRDDDPGSCGQGEPEFNCLLGHEFAAQGLPFGNLMVGLTPTRDYKRWLFVNQEGLPGDQTHESTLFFYDAPNEYGVKLELGEGMVSGSVALSYDGQRAYVARETDAGGDHKGVVVVDVRPWVPEDQRLIGSLGQDEGVSHVAVLSRPENNVYKIYQSNADDGTNPKMGLWVMPEPLVLPYQPARLLAAFDVSGSSPNYTEQELMQRSYAVQGPEIRDDGEKIVFTRVDDGNRDGVLGQGDSGWSEISTMDLEIDAYGIPTLKNETRLTHNTFSDLPPTWSPDKMGGSSYKIIFTSHRDCTGCTGQCDDACAMENDEPDADGDLFVMDEDGSNVYQITNTPNDSEYDADWAKVGSEYWVVFKSEPVVEDPDQRKCQLSYPPDPSCPPYVSTLWKAEFDPSDPTAELDPIELTNMYDEDPQGYANSQSNGYFGDYDPGVDPSGQYVVFTRHLDDTMVGPNDKDMLGDWDIFYVPLAGGTVKKLTGECDGDTDTDPEQLEEDCPSDPVDPVSADFTPVWSPDPDPSDPDVGPKIAYVAITEEVKDFYDLFRVENPLNCTLPITPVSPAECQPQKINAAGDPGTRLDERIDSGPFWHPDAFSEEYDGPDLLFDRKLLIDPVAGTYLKALGIP